MPLNKATIIGNLGRDPETRYMTSGDAVTNFSLATTEKWKDKNGDAQEHTEWHRITMFGRVAEVAAEYLKKGSQCYVEGRIQTRKYTGKDGVEKSVTEIIGDRLVLLGGKSDGGPTRERSQSTGSTPSGTTTTKPGVDFDDDIPF